MVDEFKNYGTSIAVANFRTSATPGTPRPSVKGSKKAKRGQVKNTVATMFPKVDVIVASFEDVIKWAKEGGVLTQHDFRRLVVDEFQNLSASNNKSRGAMLTNSLDRVRRLSTIAVSGTPFVAALHESAKALLTLLNVHPFSRQPAKVKVNGRMQNCEIECPYANSIEKKHAAGDPDAAKLLVTMIKAVMYRNKDNLGDVLGLQPVKYDTHVVVPCASETFVLNGVQEAITKLVVDPINKYTSEENLDYRKSIHLGAAVEYQRRSSSATGNPHKLNMLAGKNYEEVLKEKKEKTNHSLLAQAAWYNDVDGRNLYLTATYPAGFDRTALVNGIFENFKKTVLVYSNGQLFGKILAAITDAHPSAATVNIPGDAAFAGVECVVCKNIPTTLILTAKCGHNYCTTCYEETYKRCTKEFDR